MDAHVFIICEYEFLAIVNELASKLKIKIEVEVEPVGEGGIKAWFQFSDISGKDVRKAFLFFCLCSFFAHLLRQH